MYGCRKCLCESSCEAGGETLRRRREREGGGRGEGEEEEERREEAERGRGGKKCREPERAASPVLMLWFSGWLDAGSEIFIQARAPRSSRAQRGPAGVPEPGGPAAKSERDLAP